MGPSGSLIKGCGCTGTWAWSLACRAVPFPRAVAILPGCELPSEQHKHFALKATFSHAIMPKKILKTQAAFSQPGPVCCPLNPGEPPWAPRTLGHIPVSHRQSYMAKWSPSCIIPQASTKPQFTCFCAWQVPAVNYLWSSSCQWITSWW